MSAMRKLGAVALLAGLSAVILPVPPAEAEVTRTKSNCKTAWAILVQDNLNTRSTVKRLIDEDKRLLDEGYEEGVAYKLDLMVFDSLTTKQPVIVAHCGHGGTCNRLANKVHREYKTTSPVVVCMHPHPNSIANGRSL